MTVFAAIQCRRREISTQLTKVPFFNDDPAPCLLKGSLNEVRRETAVIHDGPHGLELAAPFDGAPEHGVEVEDVIKRPAVCFEIVTIIAAMQRNAAQGRRDVILIVDEAEKPQDVTAARRGDTSKASTAEPSGSPKEATMESAPKPQVQSRTDKASSDEVPP